MMHVLMLPNNRGFKGMFLCIHHAIELCNGYAVCTSTSWYLIAPKQEMEHSRKKRDKQRHLLEMVINKSTKNHRMEVLLSLLVRLLLRTPRNQNDSHWSVE